MDPFTLSLIYGTGMAGFQAMQSRGNQRAQYHSNKKLMKLQNEMNRENQQWLLQQHKQMSLDQRIYDSPQAQMDRFRAAGLNPNLIYGQGSSGNMGSPVSVPGLPGAQMAPVDMSMNLPGAFNQGFIGAMQAGLADARIEQTLADTQVKTVQAEIARTNPMLKPYVAEQVTMAMMEAARLKRDEIGILQEREIGPDGYAVSESVMSRKIRAEVEALEQRLNLNTSDLEIKNKILESKEFENAIKELQTKWLKDAEVTPEHIRQGLMLILGKMMGR